MTLRRVELPVGVSGSLWLAAMPGRFDAWSWFEAEARRLPLALVVCLTPRAEIARLAPDYLSAVDSGQLPFRWRHQPMVDFGLAEKVDGFVDTVQEVVRTLQAGDGALLHCAAGIGRTGTAAACVLKALGHDTLRALAAVRAAGSNPESAAQSGLIDRF